MKIGMTGNRNGISEKAIESFENFLKNTKIDEAHHGDCIGADKMFHDLCYNKKIKIIIHPPDCDKFRSFCKSEFILSPKSYLDRNKDIVNNTDILIAFPSSETEILRSGTWSTIRYARKNNKNILIIYPNGTKSYEN